MVVCSVTDGRSTVVQLEQPQSPTALTISQDCPRSLLANVQIPIVEPPPWHFVVFEVSLLSRHYIVSSILWTCCVVDFTQTKVLHTKKQGWSILMSTIRQKRSPCGRPLPPQQRPPLIMIFSDSVEDGSCPGATFWDVPSQTFQKVQLPGAISLHLYAELEVVPYGGRGHAFPIF